MLLSDILYKISLQTVSGKTDLEISAIEFDSRKVQKGHLFVAIPGTQVDGHQYIEKAIDLGASAILCERLPETLKEQVTYIQVENSAKAMGLAAANFYEQPSQQLQLVGITGTNGKTSVATLLFNLFRKLGYKCGLLSTVQNQIEDEIIDSTHTTPDSVSINKLLQEMVNKGCGFVFMEVSSHAVVMERIAGLHFAGGIFTNITQDHLDFHETFKNYIAAKKGFFDQLPKTAFALTNTDDKNGKVMLQNTKATKESYSLRGVGTFKGKILDSGLFGIQMTIDEQEVWFKLIGRFNAYNLLAVYGAAILLEEKPEDILTELSQLTPPPGRFQQIHSADGKVGIVDYAHTPDALQNVLETINDLREDIQQVITVVGCGGNRDKGKRPQMAKIAAELSHKVIMTSDNPRNEEPEAILKDMQEGISITKRKKVLSIVDRREAIKTAVMLANEGDIILVAGKGHEDYQEIKGVKQHFDDREELLAAFQG
ncbi:UDP-N-acetylmuramoyl-L-alanyl-D-glutamate--2,6-diaminopimelate ligase [Jiulongibacter sediminis]|uniref:UDP-N-acetylmuramoyl-L-alanyl-D-glutamate--2,6-diaminopimelate ligase n=1 Tax=Jiulongibacter sediminis TaxID=1605367 RepID=A0A0P7C2F9_9BACT|nr:UDP-N-acetylmuramoyl-L-alanyl-D-glutamate--2,6-diaminopimelate ligase [Jiulongibacter sediminis]KPM48222.1 UDP-N-acetylmuramoylalanyl-D-glutamate--2,6-diaminopimelate ligase [Jiulongibacter sediminis]TBX24765.1 UDP-N-acetylmuramoylalanyl-D-glutamate--2,6-diaminopimelate ligase [Jiulongibacter sediminis]